MAKKNDDLYPHLVIGMDTEHATGSAANYQWSLQPGDVEKTLFINWESEPGEEPYVKIHSRKGSGHKINVERFPLSEHLAAGQYIENAATVG
jgi:hypothetical protein